MSVRFIKGNLLDFTHWNVAAHVANCRNTFGSGLAKQIKERFPAAYEADTEAYLAVRNATDQREDLAVPELMGEFSVAVLEDGKRIVNLYAQIDYGREKRQIDYEALYTALYELKAALEIAHNEGRTHSLGLPYKLGSDRAGGDWRIIECMIRALFVESPIAVYIVQLPNQHSQSK